MAAPVHETVGSSSREYAIEGGWFVRYNVGKNVIAIREPFHAQDVLSYFVQDGDESVLIDTGMGLANILPNPETPVLLTHAHWDHIGDVAAFSNVAIFDHPLEVANLRRGQKPNLAGGFAKPNFLIPVPESFDPETFSIPAVANLELLADGQRIKVGDLTIKVIHTPGHTPGSVCYFIEQTGELFTGDTLYLGTQYFIDQTTSIDDYLKSLKKLRAETKGANLKIFPGHGTPKFGPFVASGDLLTHHIQALEGEIKPYRVIHRHGRAEIPYTRLKYPDHGFELSVPREYWQNQLGGIKGVR